MRACLGVPGKPCARPIAKGNRCEACQRENAKRRKDQGLTGERGSTHASRQRRERVLDRANRCCFYCTAPANIADHYVPLAKGGPDTEENMVAACGPCNAQKSDQMPDDFMHSNWLARRCEEVAAARRSVA
jgi:5-methylcytosine-specific restriction endonuclease McrA